LDVPIEIRFDRDVFDKQNILGFFEDSFALDKWRLFTVFVLPWKLDDVLATKLFRNFDGNVVHSIDFYGLRMPALRQSHRHAPGALLKNERLLVSEQLAGRALWTGGSSS
jgi:hypothetical protein